MRPHRLFSRPRHQCWEVCAPLIVAAGVSALAGCSTDPSNGTATTSSGPSAKTTAPPVSSLAPGAVGVSPTGVTTRVDVPAESTEEEYFQACHAAKVWMDAQPATEQPRIEPYLAMVQASESGVAGTWNMRWADLSLPRQAAVIVAAAAAANNECG